MFSPYSAIGPPEDRKSGHQIENENTLILDMPT